MARKTPVIPTAFDTATYSDLIATVSGYMDAELTAAGFSWSSSTKYSLPWVLSRVVALALGMVYRFQRYAVSGSLASTARDLEQLRLIGDERGLPWLAGTRATGFFTAIGSVGGGNTIPAGASITDKMTGLKYLTTAATTVSAATAVDVAVQAAAIGSAYLVTAHAARLDAPPSGIESDGLITANTGGYEEEPIDEYRARIVDDQISPREGGAVADWQNWTRAMLSQNVDGVWVYGPGAAVPASVDVSGYVPVGKLAVLYSLDGTGTAKIPSGANVTAMSNYLLALAARPVTAYPIAFAPVDNNVTMSLTLHATSGAVAGAEITALEAMVRTALADMLQTRLGGLSTPGATSGAVIRNSWIHDALATAGGIDWHQITALDGGSGSADVSTTNSWELSRFTVTFSWV